MNDIEFESQQFEFRNTIPRDLVHTCRPHSPLWARFAFLGGRHGTFWGGFSLHLRCVGPFSALLPFPKFPEILRMAVIELTNFFGCIVFLMNGERKLENWNHHPLIKQIPEGLSFLLWVCLWIMETDDLKYLYFDLKVIHVWLQTLLLQNINLAQCVLPDHAK